MPNTLDTTQTILAVLQSGLVVSGNSYITVQRQTVSGDALSNMRVSGYTELIYLRNARTDGQGLTGGNNTEIADYTDIDIYVSFRQSQISGVGIGSGAYSTLRQRVDDTKITIASGTFTSPPRPILISETWPQSHQQVAYGKLNYRTRYLL